MPKKAELPEANTESPLADFHCGLVTKAEVAKFLRRSQNSVDDLRAKGLLPFYRIGGRIMFRIAEIEEVLKRCRVKGVRL